MLSLIICAAVAFVLGVATGPFIHRFFNCRKGCCGFTIDSCPSKDALIDVGDFWTPPEKKTTKRKGKRKK